MFQRLAARIREQLNFLVEQYDERLRAVPGYANLPQPARRDFERHALQPIAECLEANDDRQLIQYVREQAEQVLARDFQPEWFQQAITIPQEFIAPLVETVDESNFVWRSLGHAQTAAWEIAARQRRQIELTLRESEARYQIIFDATPIMFWLKDTHNCTLRINKAAAELEGVKPAEVEGKSAYDLYPREQAEAFYQDDLEVIRTNRPKLGIVEQHTSVGTGQLMWVETGKTPVHNDHGAVVGVLAFAIDVTERRRLEEQVQKSFVRRGIQVQTSTEVAQEIASATDLHELFRRVVTLIKERFNYYHAQLFRYEPAQDAVVLITGYGAIGQKMLEAGHTLPMGRGVVGTAALTGKSILATDVQQDSDWRPNPHLPRTQGELAVPIKWRDQMLGILDVQSDQAGLLTEDDRLLLEGLCGQIATAMESKRLLDTVQQSEQLMRTLIDAIPAYIYAKDLQGRHMLGNAALARLYGLASPAELLGKTDFDFYPRELAEQYQASEMPILQEGTGLLGHEELNIGADGAERWNSTTKVPLRDPHGQIIGLVGITSDIMERKQAEQERERSATLLRTIINTSRDLIYVKDTDSRFLVASQAVARLLGTPSAEDLIGKNDYNFFPYELAHKYYTDEQKIIQAGEPLIDVEEPSVYPDGTRIWLLTTKIPYRSPDGEVEGIVGIGRDITERKRAEQRMAETLRETERLYAAVSRESWQAYRETGNLGTGYLFDRALVQPADHVWEPEIAQALEQQALVATQSEQRAVAVTPLSVRGEPIGALGVYDDPAHPLSKEDLQLIEAVSEQVALALESARLFDQNQRDAERERTINRVTGRIRSARSVDEVLNIAAQELRLATRASRSVVEVLPEAEQPIRAGNGTDRHP